MGHASFLDDLEDDLAQVVEAAPLAALEVGHVAQRQRSEQELAQDRLHGIEDELFEEAMNATRDMLCFAEISPEPNPILEDDALERWTQELGRERALKRLRIAQASWLPGKSAPVGLKHAATLAVGIIRARSSEKGAPRSLNIAIVQLTEQPMVAYPVRKVDK